MHKVLVRVKGILGFWIEKIFKVRVRRISARTCHYTQLNLVCRKFDVNVLFDVGANEGQFATGMRQVGYMGRIVSFEPIQDAYSVLANRSSHDARWDCFRPVAVADSSGRAQFNVSDNSVSSSLREVLQSHTDIAPSSQVNEVIEVEKISMDEIYDELGFCGSEKICLKIDTQGSEWEVLRGAQRVMHLCGVVVVEVSIVALYEGQRLWLDIMNYMEGHGFSVYCVQPGFTDRETGQTLQVDLVFVRSTRDGHPDNALI